MSDTPPILSNPDSTPEVPDDAGSAQDAPGGDAAAARDAEATKALPPAAQRALAEAEARRALAKAEAKALPRELGGRDGLDPVRYGDWEKKGIAIDF